MCWLGIFTICAIGIGSPPAFGRELIQTGESASDDTEPNDQAEFVELSQDRAFIDSFIANRHAVESISGPIPLRPRVRNRSSSTSLKVIRSEGAPHEMLNVESITNRTKTLAGFFAGVLSSDEREIPIQFQADHASKMEREAARFVESHLASDGLRSTLVNAIRTLGTDQFTAANGRGELSLRKIGFPLDLMEHFVPQEGVELSVADVLSRTAKRLNLGDTPEEIIEDLERTVFRFKKSQPSFRVSPEDGSSPIRFLRMQIGGGFDGGIIPGDSIDVAKQLIAGAHGIDFVVSIPDEFSRNLIWLAENDWLRNRRNQVTLIVEKADITPWAQDNGKAGVLPGETSGDPLSATIIPRFASQGDENSLFMPGDSFVMRGLKAAGHRVIQSPLLFQGGDLLAVRDPSGGQLILLVGEAEVFRNTSLGLTEAQVIQAFQTEFGADSCFVVPSASFHLDFDFSLRARAGEIVAFVNDPAAAARIIVERGIGALERGKHLTSRIAAVARRHSEASRDFEVFAALYPVVAGLRAEDGRFPASVAKWFATERMDSPAGNFQCFLVALHILGSRGPISGELGNDGERIRFFNVWRRLDARLARQSEMLQRFGWTIVRVPSMPDLYRSINSVNGVQDSKAYYMPAYGGFYRSVDQSAIAAFKAVLDEEIEVIPIYCPAAQRNHGGVHCMASAYFGTF